MTASQDFAGLGPDVILNRAEHEGFRITGQFQQLNSLENRVYALTLEDGDQIVLKFYRPHRWSKAQIAEEHQFLADLAAADFPVCLPLNLKTASSESPTVSEVNGTVFAAWKRSAGRIPDEFDDSMFASFGELLARLHTIGSKRSAPHRVVLNADTFVREPLAFLSAANAIPPGLRERYQRTAHDVADALQRSLAGVPVQRIHGDCHWGNLLFQGEKLLFLDFDDFVTGPVVQDIWMIAPAVDDAGIRQRDIVLSGYEKVRPFDRKWLSAVNPLKAARYVHYAAWIARRFDDPSFPRAFPHFGSEEYWETETRDLEQLVRGGFEPEFVEEKGYEAEEDFSKLTNRDYFYDL